MPANNARLKQTRAVSAPAAITTFPGASVRVIPDTPGRVALVIQNVGANPGLIHFKEPVQGDGSDLTLAAGAILILNQSDTCPSEALNLGSILGTTWAIIEQVLPNGGNS